MDQQALEAPECAAWRRARTPHRAEKSVARTSKLSSSSMFQSPCFRRERSTSTGGYGF